MTTTNGHQLRGMDPVRAPIDRYAVHAVHAAGAAVRLGREQNAALVYASLGPYSAAPVALRAAAALRVPCVLDLRDPWALHEAGAGAADEGARLAASARLVQVIERACLRRASWVVLNTEAALDAYRARYPWLLQRSSCIRNCFDMELYAPVRLENRAPPDRFRLVHLGRLRSDTPIDDLAEALARLSRDGRLSPEELELIQVGYLSDHERGVLDRAGLSGCLRARPSVPYAETLGLLQSCHLAVLLNAQSWRLRIPAKTYDYAAAGMPILAISPNEELDQLLGDRAGYLRAEPRDIAAIATAIDAQLTHWRATRRLPEPLPPPHALSAEVAARALADVFAQWSAGV